MMDSVTSCCATTNPSQPRAWHRNPRLFIGAIAAAVLAGLLAWQWSWLVAIGAASLLLSVAPCLAMCALGLCMHRMTANPRAANDPAPTPADHQLTEEQVR